MVCILRGRGAKGKEEYPFGFGQDDPAPGSRSAPSTMLRTSLLRVNLAGVTKGCGDVEKKRLHC
jgi:hypothetical protein